MEAKFRGGSVKFGGAPSKGWSDVNLVIISRCIAWFLFTAALGFSQLQHIAVDGLETVHWHGVADAVSAYKAHGVL